MGALVDVNNKSRLDILTSWKVLLPNLVGQLRLVEMLKDQSFEGYAVCTMQFTCML